MKKIIALILAMVMALSLVACGQTAQDDKSKDDANSTSAKTFIMGIDAEYPPFSYLDADGNYTGFDVEVCKAACDLLGWELQIFPVNWDQKLVQLDAKECDCVWSGMTILDSMKEAGYVLSTPYYDNTQVIMVKEGSDIKSSADLAGKVVAVQLGTSGEALLSEGGDLADLAATFGNLMTCDSFLKCFTELGGAAVDAVIVDKPVAVSYAAENAGFTVLDEGLGAEQYGIAFRADDAELCKTIEGAVAQLVENGTYAEIAAKYPDIQNNLTLLGRSHTQRIPNEKHSGSRRQKLPSGAYACELRIRYDITDNDREDGRGTFQNLRHFLSDAAVFSPPGHDRCPAAHEQEQDHLRHYPLFYLHSPRNPADAAAAGGDLRTVLPL